MDAIYAAFMLARPHAVPGVRGNNEDRWRPDGSPHLRASATKVRVSWSAAGVDGR